MSRDPYSSDFPPEAQDEYRVFIESERHESVDKDSKNKKRKLGKLLAKGEGRIDVPKRMVNAVRSQLVNLGI